MVHIAQLSAADPKQFQDATAEQGVSSHVGPGHVNLSELRRPVREDLQRDRGGVEACGDASLDDLAGLWAQLVHGNGLDAWHRVTLTPTRPQ
jgi:hypothetical protein